MNVSVLMSLFLKKLGHGGKDIEYSDTLLDYSPEALAYLNEGYFKAVRRLRPIQEEQIQLDELCCFDVTKLSMNCVYIRYILRNGRRLRGHVPCGGETGEVFVPGAKPQETLTVGYEFDPPPLKLDNDEPRIIPELIHGVLADYAAARVLESQGRREEAAGLYAAFERQMLMAKPVRGPFFHKYRAWEAL